MVAAMSRTRTCTRACVRACVCACVRACGRAGVRACVHVERTSEAGTPGMLRSIFSVWRNTCLE